MSSLKEQVEVDIKEFFDQIDTQNTEDKNKTLRFLLDKYIHLSTSERLMDWHDLNSIISGAKSNFADKAFPVFLGNKKRKVYENEQANLCMVESVIMHLNKNDCLKKLPKFDYREDRYEV